MAVSKVQSQAQAREELEEMEALRRRAARQAAAIVDNPVEVKTVAARVLPLGDGRVSLGIHIAGVGEAFYEKGETIPKLTEARALELEAIGYVEITSAANVEPA